MTPDSVVLLRESILPQRTPNLHCATTSRSIAIRNDADSAATAGLSRRRRQVFTQISSNGSNSRARAAVTTSTTRKNPGAPADQRAAGTTRIQIASHAGPPPSPAPSGSETEPPTAHRDHRRLHTPERRRNPSARHHLPRGAAARPERTPAHTGGNHEREPCRRPQARAGAPRLQRAAKNRHDLPASDPASRGRRDPAAANADRALPGSEEERSGEGRGRDGARVPPVAAQGRHGRSGEIWVGALKL
nr:serine/arginine repetitive matrix protein 1-like [Aegilops tauschii subsp. strangulata]